MTGHRRGHRGVLISKDHVGVVIMLPDWPVEPDRFFEVSITVVSVFTAPLSPKVILRWLLDDSDRVRSISAPCFLL